MAVEERQTNEAHAESRTGEGTDEEGAVAADHQRPQAVVEHLADLIANLCTRSTQLFEGNDPRCRIATRVGE